MTDAERIQNLEQENHNLREQLKACRGMNVELIRQGRELDLENIDLNNLLTGVKSLLEGYSRKTTKTNEALTAKQAVPGKNESVPGVD